ncbi:MAG: DNA mismatch repair protein MutS, partial [Pseudomonadota bacterium]
VREHKGDVIFLHEVRPGAADRSYGVQVGRLAGLPPAVVSRAREVLDALEAGDREDGGKTRTLIDDLPLFSTATQNPANARQTGPSELEIRLADVSPDALTPRDALDLVYELKGLLKD